MTLFTCVKKFQVNLILLNKIKYIDRVVLRYFFFIYLDRDLTYIKLTIITKLLITRIKFQTPPIYGFILWT